MATPITPQFTADTVVATSIEINYSPTWDGASWVIDPNTVTLVTRYLLASGDVVAQETGFNMPYNDLPAGGQNAVNQLNSFMEAEIAALYP